MLASDFDSFNLAICYIIHITAFTYSKVLDRLYQINKWKNLKKFTDVQ